MEDAKGRSCIIEIDGKAVDTGLHEAEVTSYGFRGKLSVLISTHR